MTSQQPSAPGVTPAAKVGNTAKSSSDKPRYWLIVGGIFALVGGVLAFALKDGDASALGVDLQALGGVLLAAGALLVAAGGLQSMAGVGGGDGGGNSDGVKSVGGLIAVVTGVVAVTALTLVVTQATGLEKDSVVAITTSAFGIISTVIGAYLGIKISSEASEKANSALETALKEGGK
jgi:hypothetical protein